VAVLERDVSKEAVDVFREDLEATDIQDNNTASIYD